jgi:ESCRT-II complex subunit VPS22
MAQKKADEMKAVSLQAAIDTVEKLEVKLAEFAQKHRAELSNDPVFRKRFLDMCAPLGIDPLSAKKSFWNNLGFDNMGDFYHELAVKVAEICLAHRNTNGGIMSMAELQSLLARRKTRLGSSLPLPSTGGSSGAKVSPADIQIAIGKLAKLGGGFRTVQVGSSTMVVSVPIELDNDHCQVMTVAIDRGGIEGEGITVDTVRQALGWSEDRAERALRLLLQQGMVWIDEYRGQSFYWFPSVWQERRSSKSNNSTPVL